MGPGVIDVKVGNDGEQEGLRQAFRPDLHRRNIEVICLFQTEVVPCPLAPAAREAGAEYWDF